MEHFMCTYGLTDLQWPPRAHVREVHETVGRPIPHFSAQKGACERPFTAIMRPRSALLPSPYWYKLAADFYPTFYFYLKVALRHESADSEEAHEGLGCHSTKHPIIMQCDKFAFENEWIIV